MLEQNAKKVLAPYLSHIHEAILGGFRHRHSAYAEETSKHTARTRASLVNDLIVDRARRLLSPLGIRVFTFQNRILFDIKGLVLVQFKKLNHGSLAANNYPTLFAQEYSSQAELPGLPPEMPRLIAGYVPTRDWTQVQSTYITMPMGDTIVWAIPLENSQPQIQFKPQDQVDDTITKRRRFRRKGDTGSTSSEATGTEGG